MTQPTRRQITITWEDISPTLQAAASMSGLDYMQALIRGDFPATPIAQLMGFHLVQVEDGAAVFKGTPGEQHFNPMGIVHGGLAATLLDSATGCAVHTILPQGKGYGTAQLSINLTRPILLTTGELTCEGRVVHRGSRIATAEATLKDAAGKLYAHGTATCYVFALEEGK